VNKFWFYSLVVFILGLAVALRIAWIKPEVKLPRNQTITFLATVKNEPKISDRNQVIEIGDSRLYVDLFPRYRVGDQLRVEGEVDENGNIFRAKIEKVGQVTGNWYLVTGLRNKISNNIKQLLPAREATLVVGTVLGVDDIERGFRDQLIKTGTIHVVVVSGQNLAIVAGLFMALAKYIGRRLSLALAILAVFCYAVLTGFEPPVVRASLMVLFSSIAIYYGRERMAIWSLLLSALVILFFSPRALFEVSFQLTFAATLGIMTLGNALCSLAAIKKRSTNLESSTGPASSFLPASAKAASFAEVATKAESAGKPASNESAAVPLESASWRRSGVGNPPTAVTRGVYPEHFDKLSVNLSKGHVFDWRQASRAIWNLFIPNAAIAISAYLFTAPVILLTFGRISLVAPIVNILVAELVFPIMILGFLTAGASLVFMPIAQILAYFAYVPAAVFVAIVNIFS